MRGQANTNRAVQARPRSAQSGGGGAKKRLFPKGTRLKARINSQTVGDTSPAFDDEYSQSFAADAAEAWERIEKEGGIADVVLLSDLNLDEDTFVSVRVEHRATMGIVQDTLVLDLDALII
jgi:hypothetical protein